MSIGHLSQPPRRQGVLFVCLGNICRSPLAEAIFMQKARERNALDRFDVDSCGTGGWHAGEGADPRSIAVALRNNVPMDHTARQLDIRADAARYHTIIAMDRSNKRGIIAAAETAGIPIPPVKLILEFSRDYGPDHEVPDPYYGGEDGFQHVFDMLLSACTGLLDSLIDPKK